VAYDSNMGDSGQFPPTRWSVIEGARSVHAEERQRALGVLVSISSVGAGAVGVTALLLLYPQLPMARVVGSDIAHAVPLTLVAGIGHWATGAIDWHLMGVLLVGSLPGIVIGSYCAHRVPETALRLVLAATLILVAGNLASHELHSSSSIIAAFAPNAAR